MLMLYIEKIVAELEKGEDVSSHDSSTNGLINRFHAYRKAQA